jgi:16S rRNA processing protein RimM
VNAGPLIGRLTGVFGIRGELKCRPLAGDEAFEAGRWYDVAAAGGEPRRLRCRSVRRHHDRLLVAFDGFESPEAAKVLAGADVRGEAGDIVLGPGEYLDADLVGLRLIDENGAELGRTVVGVAHYPAQDCLIVDPGRALVPLVKAFIRDIDLTAGTIATSLPDGLFD